jgi:hypothetical protein
VDILDRVDGTPEAKRLEKPTGLSNNRRFPAHSLLYPELHLYQRDVLRAPQFLLRVQLSEKV